MNVFINEIDLEKFALFKAELIFREVEELDLGESARYNVIETIIEYLDNYDIIWFLDVTLASPTFIFFNFVSFLSCLNISNPVNNSPNNNIIIIIFFKFIFSFHFILLYSFFCKRFL